MFFWLNSQFTDVDYLSNMPNLGLHIIKCVNMADKPTILLIFVFFCANSIADYAYVKQRQRVKCCQSTRIDMTSACHSTTLPGSSSGTFILICRNYRPPNLPLYAFAGWLLAPVTSDARRRWKNSDWILFDSMSTCRWNG